jgi:hypothetical protein
VQAPANVVLALQSVHYLSYSLLVALLIAPCLLQSVDAGRSDSSSGSPQSPFQNSSNTNTTIHAASTTNSSTAKARPVTGYDCSVDGKWALLSVLRADGRLALDVHCFYAKTTFPMAGLGAALIVMPG